MNTLFRLARKMTEGKGLRYNFEGGSKIEYSSLRERLNSNFELRKLSELRGKLSVTAIFITV